MRLEMIGIETPAMSSLGYGYGRDQDGKTVRFAGDHRPMQAIAEALRGGEPVEVEVEPYQVVAWTLADLRTPGAGEAQHIFPYDRFIFAITCPVCGCQKSGEAGEPNYIQEPCDDGDCRCHQEEEVS